MGDRMQAPACFADASRARAYGVHDFEIFNLLDIPVWVFDITKRQMHWCNTAGLHLWSAKSLAELLARDWSGDMSESTKVRLAHYLCEFMAGRTVEERWTFYPLPARMPRSVRATCSGILIKDDFQNPSLVAGDATANATGAGRMAMLVAAVNEEKVTGHEIRAVEALRHTYTMVSVYSRRDFGALYQNPAALRDHKLSAAGEAEWKAENMEKWNEEQLKHGKSDLEAVKSVLRFDERFVNLEDLAECMQVVESGGVFEKELPIWTAEGRAWHSMAVRGVKDPITGEDAFLVNEVDITTKKRLERENSDKDTFLGTISHEIRTPINGIIGFNSLMLETQLTPEQRDFTLNIQRSSKILLAHVNDLLDFAKIAQGKMRLETNLVDLKEIVTTAMNLTRPSAMEKKLRIFSNVHPAVPKILFGDPLRVSQILLNFLSNAIKFTEEGYINITIDLQRNEPSELNVSPSLRRASLEPDKEYTTGMNASNSVIVRITVEDTGIGVPWEMQKQIFSKFVQADSSISRKYGGTGLGLAICKKLTRLMGGECGCMSTANKRPSAGRGSGSTFWATVRLRTVYEPATPYRVFIISPKISPSILCHATQLHAPKSTASPSSSRHPSPRPPDSQNEESMLSNFFSLFSSKLSSVCETESAQLKTNSKVCPFQGLRQNCRTLCDVLQHCKGFEVHYLSTAEDVKRALKTRSDRARSPNDGKDNLSASNGENVRTWQPPGSRRRVNREQIKSVFVLFDSEDRIMANCEENICNASSTYKNLLHLFLQDDGGDHASNPEHRTSDSVSLTVPPLVDEADAEKGAKTDREHTGSFAVDGESEEDEDDGSEDDCEENSAVRCTFKPGPPARQRSNRWKRFELCVINKHSEDLANFLNTYVFSTTNVLASEAKNMLNLVKDKARSAPTTPQSRSRSRSLSSNSLDDVQHEVVPKEAPPTISLSPRLSSSSPAQLNSAASAPTPTISEAESAPPSNVQEDQPQCLPSKDVVSQPAGNASKILVVEDNRMNQKLIKNILLKQGYECDIAEDGLDALELINQKGLREYSVILMDIQMPKMNGFECSAAIRAMDNPYAKSIPILGVSATTGEDIQAKCLSHGMNTVIAKPYSLPIIRTHLLHYTELATQHSNV